MDSPNDVEVINRWLEENPAKAQLIARYAVNGLWIKCTTEEPEHHVIGPHDEYSSGADFIDHVNEAIEHTGLYEVICHLQKLRYPEEVEG